MMLWTCSPDKETRRPFNGERTVCPWNSGSKKLVSFSKSRNCPAKDWWLNTSLSQTIDCNELQDYLQSRSELTLGSSFQDFGNLLFQSFLLLEGNLHRGLLKSTNKLTALSRWTLMASPLWSVVDSLTALDRYFFTSPQGYSHTEHMVEEKWIL